MEKLSFIIMCHFGLEKVLKSEIRKLGLEITDVTDGEVKAVGTIDDIPRLNFNLRTAERVMIEISNFKAIEPDELLENARNCEIEKFVPVDGEFPVTKANQDKNSILRSSQANQKTVKRGFVDRLKKVYNTDILTETRGRYPFRVKFYKNICSIRLDTTGDSLHKRGYRIKSGLAPIEETLAASLVKLTDFNYKTILIDPFCGSGTIAIEAAMILSNIPPSLERAFVSETWDIIPKDAWKKARNEALSNIRQDEFNKKIRIFGFDIDDNMIKISKENAKRADVEDLIDFETSPVSNFSDLKVIDNLIDNINEFDNIKKIIILTNPPYGERMEDEKAIIPIYKDLKNSYDKLYDKIKNTNFELELNIITSVDGEIMRKIFGKEIKNRKIYNGMIKTYLYSY